MKKTLVIFLLLVLVLKCDAQKDYALLKGQAILLGSTTYWCSFPDEYSTELLQGNQPTSSCYKKTFTYGKWFKFQAPQTLAEIKIKVGGESGTMQWPRVSIWNEDMQELDCKNSIDDTVDISLNYTKFIPGEWYYISVNHNNNPQYVGSFTLCITSELSNDYKDGATFVGNTNNWSSAKGEFSTNSASPDGEKTVCMSSGPNFNRWFQFISKAQTATIEVKSGDGYGTLKNPYVTLFDSDMREIACDKYVDNVECKIEINQLTIGETYFISVDHANNESYKGTFTLCINNVSEKDKNVLLKITNFDKTDLIKITGELMYNINSPLKNSKVWLLNNKNIKVDSTTSNVKGQFGFDELPPNQNFLIVIEDVKKEIKVNIFQTDNGGEIIKKTIWINKNTYGFEDLPLLCNRIVLIDCASNFDVKIEQGKTGVVGKVVKRTNPIQGMPSIGVTLYAGIKNTIANTVTNAEGEFEFTNLPPNSNYTIKLDANSNEVYAEMLMIDDNGNPFMSSSSKNRDKNGFFSFEKLPYITAQELRLIMEEDVELTDFSNLKKGTSIKINNVYFESGKSNLLSRSYRELDRLVSSLKENNNVKIEIQGYTDNVGSTSANKLLSEKRAKSVVDYLVVKNIKATRLSYKGFGDSQPVGDNNLEEGRKKNRRVEFIVIE